MKRAINTVGALSLVGVAVLTAPLAVASDSGWIGGLSVGQSIARIDDAKIIDQQTAAGLTTTSVSNDDRNTAYKIFGGYKFNRYFVLEGGYFDLGRFGFTATTVPAGTLNGYIKLKGVNLDAVGYMPITDKFSAFARGGFHYAESRDSYTNTGAVSVPTNPNPSQNAYNFKAGLGLQYDFSEAVSLRGEWERFRINDAVGARGDADMISMGLVVMLGDNAPVPVPAPMPALAVAEQPMPAQVLVIVPVAVKTERYCSILDIQFEINREVIQREDKEKLAAVGAFLKKHPNTTALIEGHSDNVGSSEHNLELSQHRADSVVNYLVDGFQIAPSRLKAVGYGESRPIADNSTEEGKQKNRRIDAVIACVTDVEGLKVTPARITMALEMEFARNKTDIAPEYHDELQKVADFLKANPSATATVEGHTGNLQSTPDLAMSMSQRRAQAVVNYLKETFGVSASQLSSQGFGQTRRVAYNTSLEGQQENRRVNIIINYSK